MFKAYLKIQYKNLETLWKLALIKVNSETGRQLFTDEMEI